MDGVALALTAGWLRTYAEEADSLGGIHVGRINRYAHGSRNVGSGLSGKFVVVVEKEGGDALAKSRRTAPSWGIRGWPRRPG